MRKLSLILCVLITLFSIQIGNGQNEVFTKKISTDTNDSFEFVTSIPAGKVYFERDSSGQYILAKYTINKELNKKKNTFSNGLIYFCLTLFAFVFLFIWRGRRSEQAQIKKMSGELKSLELRALQSQMNPHFIFNCLSSIQSLYLLGESERANEYLSQFSKLLRIILEHAQKRLISLKEDLDMFKIYIPLEGLQFDDPFEFELSVDANVNAETLFIPSMVTHTFIENAIKHGIKPLKNRKGSLKINVSKTDSQVVLRIRDNGIGYEKSLATKTANKRTHKSRGIDITNQRIDILNLLNDLDIQVETNNLKNSKGESKGTEIILYFPIIEDYEDFNR